jgi:dihydroflavonol-4-reductase
MKTVLVTGGTGRLGNVLVKELVKEGFKVKVLVLPNDRLVESIEGVDCEIITGSVLDTGSVTQALQGVDVVFHLATKILLAPDTDHSVWNIIVEGTRNVATCCLEKGVDRLIHCSSHHALIHEPYSSALDETRPLALNDTSTYHRAKAHSEAFVLDLIAKGLKAVIVSPGTLLGPDDYEPSIFGQALIDLYNGKIPILMEGLSDYSDVRDVSSGMIAAYRKGIIGERYLLTGFMLNMKDLSKMVGEITGKRTPKTILPLWLMYGLLPMIDLFAKIQGRKALFTKEMLKASQSNPHVSHQKAKEALGFSPRDLKESFKDTFDWYKKMEYIK